MRENRVKGIETDLKGLAVRDANEQCDVINIMNKGVRGFSS